jgi:hypothetical protein
MKFKIKKIKISTIFVGIYHGEEQDDNEYSGIYY